MFRRQMEIGSVHFIGFSAEIERAPRPLKKDHSCVEISLEHWVRLGVFLVGGGELGCLWGLKIEGRRHVDG